MYTCFYTDNKIIEQTRAGKTQVRPTRRLPTFINGGKLRGRYGQVRNIHLAGKGSEKVRVRKGRTARNMHDVCVACTSQYVSRLSSCLPLCLCVFLSVFCIPTFFLFERLKIWCFLSVQLTLIQIYLSISLYLHIHKGIYLSLSVGVSHSLITDIKFSSSLIII